MDLAQYYNASIGLGILSIIGNLIWVATISISIFAYKLIGNYNSSESRFLFLGSIFTSIICLDDLFLIHDRYINEKILFLFYVIFAIYLFYFFVSKIKYVNLSF